MTKGERPTTEHITFNNRILVAGRRLGQTALARLYEACGAPEDGSNLQREIEFGFNVTLPLPASHYYEGDITGSDAFSFYYYYLPTEAWDTGEPNFAYPGFILSMSLRFDTPEGNSQKRQNFLFSTRDTPPTLVDMERYPTPHLVPGSLEQLNEITNRAPNLIYYPDEQELRTIRTAFESLTAQDVNIASILDGVDDGTGTEVGSHPWLVAAREHFPLD